MISKIGGTHVEEQAPTDAREYSAREASASIYQRERKLTEMKSAIEKVTWVGRITVFAVGLAVVLALTVGLATTALAAVPGDPFKLGKTNAVNAISRLAGSVAGPSLQINNGSENASATALDLRVEPGKAPMKVNSGVKVVKLNVDQVDAKSASDFLPRRTYTKEGTSADIPGNFARVSATCDPGDVALSGGYQFGPFGDIHIVEVRLEGNTYEMTFGGDNSATANVTCADFPPLRQQ